ncbi:MAG: glutamine synthetase, partial [Cyanobacteria bacterium P01_F01_bin.3]
TATYFTQGILDHAPAMMPLIGPTPNCYRRLKPHTFAPSNISWGIEDRTAMVRVKATKDDGTHLEMRAASGMSNPYLSAAATLAAGLLGLKGKRDLQPMSTGPSEEDASLKPFPKTLDAALAALDTDTKMQEMLGTEFCHLFSTVKAYELNRFHEHITDWEVSEYLEMY